MGNQLQKRPSDVQTIKSLLFENQEVIDKSLPSFLTADRLIGVALTIMTKNPQLQNCTRASLIGSIRQAGLLGLEPDGIHGALIPYRNHGVLEAQFQPMYQGLIKLGHMSDKITLLYAEIVRANDIFHYTRGLHPDLIHEPLMSGDRGNIIAGYSVFNLVNGGADFEPMTIDELNKVKAKALAGKKKQGESPWTTWPEEMYKKTVIKRLAKRMPKNRAMQEVVNYDNLLESSKRRVTSNHLLEDMTPEVKADMIPEIAEPQPAEPTPSQEPPKEKKTKKAEQSGEDLVTG